MVKYLPYRNSLGAKMDYPSTRKEAKILNTKYYFTNKPCIRGHIDLRETNKGICKECRKIEWTKENERRSKLPKSEAAKESARRYYEKNKDLVKARAAARPDEEKNRWKKIHKSNNKEYYNVLNSLRKRRHRLATPKWLTYRQKQDIKALYQQAVTLSTLTGEQYAVDHIVPINGEAVCGLHVPWNLRVITQEENLKKSNKHDIDT